MTYREPSHPERSQHYLNEHASSGMQSHMAAISEATSGSKQLLEALEAHFRRWEKANGFKRGAGRILVPAGYRE